MANRIKQGFHTELIELSVVNLIPTKNISVHVRQGKKYGQILSSIQEVGLIEAPVVSPFNNSGEYLLLDGHLRIMALKELGVERVTCLISTEDESYTYNKHINRLSAIQEHRMIVKALQSGVSEEKLAKALNLDIKTIKGKVHMLSGICKEVADILKENMVPESVFRVLKKMKTPRQIQVAMLMKGQNRFTASFAKALLEMTAPDQLVDQGKPTKYTPAMLAKQVRLENESLALSQDLETLNEQYGTQIVDMTAMQAYLKRLLGNEDVAKYLLRFDESIYGKLTEIAKLDFFRLNSMG